MTPAQTLEVLAELQALGFTDDSFWRLHHWRKDGRGETVAGFRGYCETLQKFQEDGSNVRVARRLAFVLRTYREWGLPQGNTEVFQALADAAYLGIQPRF